MSEEQKAVTKADVFTFGDAEPVMDARGVLDYVEAYWTGKWYEPPISLDALAKSFRANPHHSSAIYVKRDALVRTYIPHPALSRSDFSRLALDYLIMGNGYVERGDNALGRLLKLAPLPAKYTRRGKNGSFWWAPNPWEQQERKRGAVFQLMEPDVNQELYGVPQYISAMQSAWLNEAATLFRRRYYLNGSHAGFILYMTDAAHNENDIEALRNALKDSKGPGNFRNLFMYAPNGKKDGIQLFPIAEVAAKDEFFHIKTITRDDVLAAHRVPPQLMGIVPTNSSGFGDAEKAAMVFAANEIEPLQQRFTEINDWMGEEVIRFRPYTIGQVEETKK